MKIRKRFAILPADRNGGGVMSLREDGREVYAFHISYAPETPEYRVFADLGPFEGRDLTFFYEGEEIAPPELTDAPEISDEDRPLAHFTAPWGWINDPNGLSWYRGKYRLFCQHNPFSDRWGNMHWGYAVSDDLLHWTWKGEALYPDRIDATIYSGSAVVDRDGTAGFGAGAHVLIYTLAREDGSYTQNLARSPDGERYEKYAGNPVIGTICSGNRDPKVIRFPGKDLWILALYLEDHDFALFASKDLKNWREIQRVTFPEGSECPDFFPLPAPDGGEKWVFLNAAGWYYVGGFDGERFTPEGGAKRLTRRREERPFPYAGQTFSDDPDGKRRIVFWEMVGLEGLPYTSQHSLPLDLSLRRGEDGFYLAAALPEQIVSRLRPKREGEELPYVFRTDLSAPVRLGGHLLERTAAGAALDGEEIGMGAGEILFAADRHSLEFLSDGGTAFGLWEARIDLRPLPEGAAAESIAL